MPAFAMHTDRAALQIPAADVSSPAWDYVALGDYHVYKKASGRSAFLTGSLFDYTSTGQRGGQIGGGSSFPGRG